MIQELRKNAISANDDVSHMQSDIAHVQTIQRSKHKGERGLLIGLALEPQPTEPADNENTSYRLPKPFRQGRFDTYCGIYALMNAFRWAGRNNGDKKSGQLLLFDNLLSKSMKRLGPALLSNRGIDDAHMRRLAKICIKHFAIYDQHFEVIKPNSLFPDLPLSEATRLEWMKRATTTPGTAILVTIKTWEIHHWTVVSGIRAGRLQLFDSGTSKQTRIETCKVWRVVKLIDGQNSG